MTHSTMTPTADTGEMPVTDPRLLAIMDAGFALVPSHKVFRRADVIRLVRAARTVAFGDDHGGEKGMRELDAASEQFADSVPWDDEPSEEEPASTPVRS